MAVGTGAVLRHNLGAPVEGRVAGRALRASGHNMVRRYYMARNRLHLWRRWAWRFPHWALFDAVMATKMLINPLLLEPDRFCQLRAFLLGSLDGLRGRTGPVIRRV